MTTDCAIRLEPERHEGLHPELDHWRSNVGDPVALDLAPRAPDRIDGIDVLCWNVAIGLGRLDRLVERLRTGAFGGAGQGPERPLVVLVQEAFRADTSVPGGNGSRHHGGRLTPRDRLDIIELARGAGLSLRYSPSMRNGLHPSDRGNAILSTVALDDAHAFVLPYVRQRRVVVTARIAGQRHIAFASAHLDTHGRARTEAARQGYGLGAGRAVQARALADSLSASGGSVVLGADLNSLLGMTDPAIRALTDAGLHPARRVGTWRHTFHTPFRLLLDHVMYRSEDGRIAGAEVVRVDEDAEDRSRDVFGSDHHPLLARIELTAD